MARSCSRRARALLNLQMQNVPPVDPENEEFVIFIRATSGVRIGGGRCARCAPLQSGAAWCQLPGKNSGAAAGMHPAYVACDGRKWTQPHPCAKVPPRRAAPPQHAAAPSLSREPSVPSADAPAPPPITPLFKKPQSYQQWMNMSVVKGGSSANLLVKGMSTEWGRRLYARTLLSNIAQSLYKERDAIIKGLRDSVRQQVRGEAARCSCV